MKNNGLNSCYYGSRAIILHTLGVQIMESKMQATKVCWGNIGIMRKKMDTTADFIANLRGTQDPYYGYPSGTYNRDRRESHRVNPKP